MGDISRIPDVSPHALDVLRRNVLIRLRGNHVEIPRGGQAAFAEAIQMQPGQLSRFLHEDGGLGWEYVDAMAAHFGCQISDLFVAPTDSNDSAKLSSRRTSPVTLRHGKTTVAPSPIGGGYGSTPADARIYELEETIKHVLIEGRDILERFAVVLNAGEVRQTARRTSRTRKVSGSPRHRPT